MISPAARRFRPGVAVSVIAAVGLMIFIAMGSWQLNRAQQKLELQQRLDERSRGPAIEVPPRLVPLEEMAYAHVAVHGEFLPKFTILLDNRTHAGVVGYEVITPVKIAGGELSVLIDRGWIAAGARRDQLPQIATPAAPVALEGIAEAPRRFFEFGNAAPTGPVWQNLTVERFAASSGLKLQPFLVHQSGAADDGLLHVSERPDTGVSMHRGYAFQWFTFAALVVILYIALNFKRIEPTGFSNDAKQSKQQQKH